METLTKSPLTLSEFLSLSDDDITYELIDEEAIAKMSPKSFHSRVTLNLAFLLDEWNKTQENHGEVGIEWAVILKRKGKDWCPVPDLLYISGERLKNIPLEDIACTIPPELVIEIISPNQSFTSLNEKAIDYLNSGVDRVWLVDSQAKKNNYFLS
jgi:Uma2 family endonuclease